MAELITGGSDIDLFAAEDIAVFIDTFHNQRICIQDTGKTLYLDQSTANGITFIRFAD